MEPYQISQTSQRPTTVLLAPRWIQKRSVQSGKNGGSSFSCKAMYLDTQHFETLSSCHFLTCIRTHLYTLLATSSFVCGVCSFTRSTRNQIVEVLPILFIFTFVDSRGLQTFRWFFEVCPSLCIDHLKTLSFSTNTWLPGASETVFVWIYSKMFSVLNTLSGNM